MKILQVSPSLPVDVCTQATCLSQHGYLHRLFTSTAINGNGIAGRMVGRWMSRREVHVGADRLRPIYSADIRQRLTRLCGGTPVVSADERFDRVDRTASRSVDDHLDAVLCREDAAIHTFRRAAECGVLRLYDLPTAHFRATRRLMLDELERFPELEPVLAMGDEYSAARNARKSTELGLADRILCPSEYVRRSLVEAGYADERVRVIPFGCDPDGAQPAGVMRANVVLSVGRISVRKGSHRLLEAWKRIGAYRTHTLRLVGEIDLPQSYLGRFAGMYEHIGTLPRHRLMREYAAAKFCVFNHMSEGMAVVIPEALSAGTPVIATRNSGAEEIVTSGEEGLLIDYGDDGGLAEAIATLLESPGRLAFMGERAKARARARTWSDYAAEFIGWLESASPAAAA